MPTPELHLSIRSDLYMATDLIQTTKDNRSDAEPIELSTHAVSFPLPQITEKPVRVLECDQRTPDAHVTRDSRLIRLTGIHPLNCEAPLSALFDSGFLTPSELWYVRNHGAVPEVLDNDLLNWKISIEGMVEQPMTLTLSDLLALPQVTIPVTLVCAGNRRKEQNVVRKGNGFNWGSAGVSTALFTGVMVSEVLKMAKLIHGARYMCMEGADKLPNGYYGTSIRLSTAMDPAMGVMLAHKMNGELLTPDHGRPLRVVIPGQIGGRSVKWLKKLIISAKPSDNWYHIFDNRVLPTMATPEVVAKDESWYYDERYALYNLNVQSVICYPAHEEVVKVEKDESYPVRGYAYNGGGVRIGRVEISFDQGDTWKLAQIDYPEDRYREVTCGGQLFGGKLDMPERENAFCWCFWHIKIPIVELRKAKDIVVRAMDESMNVQPREMYWNTLSMMNNCWHRLTITQLSDGTGLKFDHPTLPAFTAGGWMEKVKAEGGKLTDGFWGSGNISANRTVEQSISTIKLHDESIERMITDDELRKHNKDGDAWFTVNGHVYDASEYLKEHPGGISAIVLAGGADATDDFMAIHSDTAKAMLSKYHIGILETKGSETRTIADESGDSIQGDIFLHQKKWNPATVKTKTTISHDTVRLTLALKHAAQALGLPTGKHLYVRCITSSGDKVVRSYTPISSPVQRGEFDLLIKLYRARDDRPAGKMSACIDSLRVGDAIECKGPFGDFEYQEDGLFLNRSLPTKINKLTLIAGGSGITAIYQILQRAHRDGVECNVIYCNKTEEDILLREELAAINRCRYCLSRPADAWNGPRGYISPALIGPVHDGLLLCSGPPEMVNCAYTMAAEMGWNMSQQFIRF